MTASDRHGPSWHDASSHRESVDRGTGPFSAGGSGSQSDELLAGTLAAYVDFCSRTEAIGLPEFFKRHPDLSVGVSEELATFEELKWTVEASGPDVADIADIFGDFEIRGTLGGGAFGIVYDASYRPLQRRVALKVLRPGLLADRKAFERFRREARLVARLDHPNIVRVYSTGVQAGTPYINMEFIDGENLQAILNALRSLDDDGGSSQPSEKTMSELSPDDSGIGALAERSPLGFLIGDGTSYFEWVAETFARVAEGLQHAHSHGVIHRDLKPSNVILGSDGVVRILDFGLARADEGMSVSESGDRVGTPLYMSPEQIDVPSRDLGPSTDIYSLGATLYEMLCLRPPLQGRNHAETLEKIRNEDPPLLRKRNARVPRDLEVIVGKCLEKRPADRFGTAEALSQELRRFARGDPIETAPPSRYSVLARRLWRARRSVGKAAIVAALIVSTGLLAYYLWASIDADALRRYNDRVARAREVVRWEEIKQATSRSVPNRWDEVRLNPWEEIPVTLDLHTGGTQKLFEGVYGPSATTELFEAGSTLVSPDSLEKALRDLRAAKEDLPEEPDAYVLLARGQLLEGHRALALESLETAIEKNAEFVPALVLRRQISGGEKAENPTLREKAWAAAWMEAVIAEKAQNWKKAAASYDRAVELLEGDEESNAEVAMELRLKSGLAHLNVGERQNLFEAKENFESCKHEWRDRLEPALLLGKAYLLLETEELADYEFKRFFYSRKKIKRDQLEVARAVSAVYRELGRLDEALRWAENAEKLDPKNLAARLAVGKVFMERGELEDAEAHFARAVEENPKSGEACYHHARILVKLDRFPEAMERYRRAIDARGAYAAPSRNNLGTVLDRQGRLEDAIEEYRAAIDLAPGLAVAHFNLGWAYQRQRRLAEATAAYREAIELGFDRAVVYNNLAPCLLEQLDLEGAIEVLEKAVERDSENPLTYKNLGTAYFWRYKWAEQENAKQYATKALAFCERVMALEPEWAEAKLRVGELLAILGQVDAAIRAYREAVTLEPTYRAAHDGLARLLLGEDRPLPEREDLDDAIRTLERGESSKPSGSPARLLLETYRDALRPDVASCASIDWLIDRPEPLVSPRATWSIFRGMEAPRPGLSWTRADFDDDSWESGLAPFGYPAAKGLGTPLHGMPGSYTSLYARRLFAVPEPSGLEMLQLRVRVREDDGFVAYLNGHEVARKRFGKDETPSYDATAEATRRLRKWKVPEMHTYQLDAKRLLRRGDNVLALYGVNSAVDDEDFLLEAVLLASPLSNAESERRARKQFQAFQELADPVDDRGRLAYFEGRLSQLSGDHVAAVARFEEALTADPGRPEPYLRLVDSLRAIDDAIAAEALLREALGDRLLGEERLWDQWLHVAMVDLRWTPTQILARFPAAEPGEATEREADILWVLEKLEAEEAIRINCGGTDYETSSESWSRERFLHESGLDFYLHELNERIAEIPDTAVFLTSRVFWSRDVIVPGYSVPVPPGDYTVTLIFVEGWKSVADVREFDVLLERKVVLPRYRPGRRGFGVHDSRTFEVVVLDGVLDIEFVRRIDDPEICAFVIERKR